MNFLYRFFAKNQPRRLILISFLFILMQKSFSQEKTNSFYEYLQKKINGKNFLSILNSIP